MAKIIRKKKLFEEGEQNQAVQQNANQQQPVQNAPAPDANTQQQQPQAVQQQPQPQNTTAPQQQNQQNAQQPQQPSDDEKKKAEELNQKVQSVLQQMENVYWSISNNVPEEIQKIIPDFKEGNQLADEAIKLWGVLKQQPSKENYDKFVDAFARFGNGQQNVQNQQQPTQTPAQQAVQNATQNESEIMDFGERLKAKMMKRNEENYHKAIVENYFRSQPANIVFVEG